MKITFFYFLLFLVYTSSYSQIINFPDTNFKTKLLSAESGNGIAYLCNGSSFKVDTNNDGEIEVSEALLVCNLFINDSNISDLTGIEFFTNLKDLQCNNNSITELDLSALTNIIGLNVNNNQLTSVNINGLSQAHNISFKDNQLTSINVLGLSNLEILDIRNNQITSLSLDEAPQLRYLYCQNNDLSSIDVSTLENLGYLDCSFNNLTTLNIRNESNESFLNFSNNENLQFICADGEQLSDVENKITQYGYTDCQTNSLCNFTSGESFYPLLGNVKYDENDDGCSSIDIDYQDLLLTVSDGVNSGNMYSNSNGDYQYNIQAGNYSITPIVSNSTYFNISPTTTSVSFPNANNPYIQDFCLTPAGSFPDLGISVTTINTDYDNTATFRIIYKNKGTMTQSGIVNFTFDDSVIDFNTAIPTVSEQNTNELIWEYTDLKPFESRTIDFILSFNVPPIENNDVLNFTGTISSDLTETTPIDNTYNFNHTFQCCLLSVPSFEFSDYFTQYPNPTYDFINLEMKKQINIESVIIYNMLGQEVKKVLYKNEHIKIDVSNLESGHYFIKILALEQEFTSRFIRK